MNQELQALKQDIEVDFKLYQEKFKELQKAKDDYKAYEKKQDDLNMILGFFNKLVDSKRREIMDKVTNLVTYGLQSIFNDSSMKLLIKEKVQRNQKFYSFAVSIDGVETEDWSSASGGVVDVLSFMLRVVFITVSSNRRFIVLDEPFKGLSKNYRENLGDFLRMLSEKLNVQFFIVSHQDEVSACADKLFQIRKVEDKVHIFDIT